MHIQVDACVNHNLQQFGVGGVIMDQRGRTLLAFGHKLTAPVSVVDGELREIHEA